MAQANVKLTVDASQATRALRGVNNQTKNLQSSFGFLKSSPNGTLVYDAIRDLLSNLKDPYTRFLDPKEEVYKIKITQIDLSST